MNGAITLGEGDVLTDATVRMPRAFAMPVLVNGQDTGIIVHVSASPVVAQSPSDADIMHAAAQIGAAVKFASRLAE